MNIYWLIEWPQQREPLTYLHPSAEWLSRGVHDWPVESIRVEKWTNDVREAVRFPSKEDAEAVIRWMWGPHRETYIATEHEDAAPSVATEEQRPVGSSVCPICGKDSPHYHGPDEATMYNAKFVGVGPQFVQDALQHVYAAMDAMRRKGSRENYDRGYNAGFNVSADILEACLGEIKKKLGWMAERTGEFPPIVFDAEAASNKQDNSSPSQDALPVVSGDLEIVADAPMNPGEMKFVTREAPSQDAIMAAAREITEHYQSNTVMSRLAMDKIASIIRQHLGERQK